MWMRIELDAARDWRVKLLASRLGVSRGDAFVMVFEVWAQLYRRGGGMLSEDEVDAVAERQGFARALVECHLAEETKDGIRIKGDGRVRELRAKLERRAEAAKETWKRKRANKSDAFAEQMQSKCSADAEQMRSKCSANAEHSYLFFSSLLSSSSPSEKPRKSKKASEGSSPRAEGLRQVTDEFQARYLERTGVKPTWGAKQIAQLKPLVLQHGAAEVCRRIRILFDHPPRWLTGAPDVGFLVSHFDKLAITASDQLDGPGLLAIAARLEGE